MVAATAVVVASVAVAAVAAAIAAAVDTSAATNEALLTATATTAVDARAPSVSRVAVVVADIFAIVVVYDAKASAVVRGANIEVAAVFARGARGVAAPN